MPDKLLCTEFWPNTSRCVFRKGVCDYQVRTVVMYPVLTYSLQTYGRSPRRKVLKVSVGRPTRNIPKSLRHTGAPFSVAPPIALPSCLLNSVSPHQLLKVFAREPFSPDRAFLLLNRRAGLSVDEKSPRLFLEMRQAGEDQVSVLSAEPEWRLPHEQSPGPRLVSSGVWGRREHDARQETRPERSQQIRRRTAEHLVEKPAYVEAFLKVTAEARHHDAEHDFQIARPILHSQDVCQVTGT